MLGVMPGARKLCSYLFKRNAAAVFIYSMSLFCGAKFLSVPKFARVGECGMSVGMGKRVASVAIGNYRRGLV